MGKTFRRDSQFRPKKQGRIFTKEQSWKKNKNKQNIDPVEIIYPEDVTGSLKNEL